MAPLLGRSPPGSRQYVSANHLLNFHHYQAPRGQVQPPPCCAHNCWLACLTVPVSDAHGRGISKVIVMNLQAGRAGPVQGYDGHGTWRGRGRGPHGHRHPGFNRELFLQANFRFLVSDTADLSKHALDADKMLDWDDVIEVGACRRL